MRFHQNVHITFIDEPRLQQEKNMLRDIPNRKATNLLLDLLQVREVTVVPL